MKRLDNVSVALPEPITTPLATVHPASVDYTLANWCGFSSKDMGQRVFVEGRGAGVIKFVGPHAVSSDPRIGVQLDVPNGTIIYIYIVRHHFPWLCLCIYIFICILKD